ncbi:MAG: mannose-1-phosphate guanyltransferase, partial [Verrucomicrobia bacterium]
VVLVGGLGTRLGELTRSVPKPMLPIGGRPFLEHIVALLGRNGVGRVVFCVSHLGEVIRNHFGAGEKFGVAISYSHEPSPLGTGGAIRLARAQLDDQFLVLNGDTIFDIPLPQLAQLLTAHPTALAAMALRRVDDAGRYGSVRLDGEHVVAFEEKGRTGAGLINGGIYCLRRDALAHLPESASSLERDLFPRLAAARQLCARAFDGYFIDIGIPADLARANEELPKRLVVCGVHS